MLNKAAKDFQFILQVKLSMEPESCSSGSQRTKAFVTVLPYLYRSYGYQQIIFISTYLMGAQCCAGDIFKKLYEQYGETFVKLMVAEKGKDVVRDEFGKVKTDLDGTFNGVTGQTNSLVDNKTNELTKIYEGVKQKLNFGGALQMLEQQQGKSLDEISGYNGIKGQITNVRKQTLGKLEEQHKTLSAKVNSTQSDMVTKIQKEKPKIEMYDNLPEPLQKVVRDTAEKQFAKQLGDNKEAIVKTIVGQFGPDSIKQIFSSLSPESALNGIVGGSTSKFTSALSGGAGGALGGLGGGGGFGGLF